MVQHGSVATCGVTLRTATLFVGWLQMAFASLGFLGLASIAFSFKEIPEQIQNALLNEGVKADLFRGFIWISLMVLILDIVVLYCLLLGVYSNRPDWLVPYLAYFALKVVILIPRLFTSGHLTLMRVVTPGFILYFLLVVAMYYGTHRGANVGSTTSQISIVPQQKDSAKNNTVTWNIV